MASKSVAPSVIESPTPRRLRWWSIVFAKVVQCEKFADAGSNPYFTIEVRRLPVPHHSTLLAASRMASALSVRGLCVAAHSIALAKACAVSG